MLVREVGLSFFSLTTSLQIIDIEVMVAIKYFIFFFYVSGRVCIRLCPLNVMQNYNSEEF